MLFVEHSKVQILSDIFHLVESSIASKNIVINIVSSFKFCWYDFVRNMSVLKSSSISTFCSCFPHYDNEFMIINSFLRLDSLSFSHSESHYSNLSGNMPCSFSKLVF